MRLSSWILISVGETARWSIRLGISTLSKMEHEWATYHKRERFLGPTECIYKLAQSDWTQWCVSRQAGTVVESCVEVNFTWTNEKTSQTSCPNAALYSPPSIEKSKAFEDFLQEWHKIKEQMKSQPVFPVSTTPDRFPKQSHILLRWPSNKLENEKVSSRYS